MSFRDVAPQSVSLTSASDSPTWLLEEVEVPPHSETTFRFVPCGLSLDEEDAGDTGTHNTSWASADTRSWEHTGFNGTTEENRWSTDWPKAADVLRIDSGGASGHSHSYTTEGSRDSLSKAPTQESNPSVASWQLQQVPDARTSKSVGGQRGNFPKPVAQRSATPGGRLPSERAVLRIGSDEAQDAPGDSWCERLQEASRPRGFRNRFSAAHVEDEDVCGQAPETFPQVPPDDLQPALDLVSKEARDPSLSPAVSSRALGSALAQFRAEARIQAISHHPAPLLIDVDSPRRRSVSQGRSRSGPMVPVMYNQVDRHLAFPSGGSDGPGTAGRMPQRFASRPQSPAISESIAAQVEDIPLKPSPRSLPSPQAHSFSDSSSDSIPVSGETLWMQVNMVCTRGRDERALAALGSTLVAPSELGRGLPADCGPPWNVGFLPETWEAVAEEEMVEEGPLAMKEPENASGRQLEVVEVGLDRLHPGEVYTVKPLGSFVVVRKGLSMATTIVGIRGDLGLWKGVNSLEELEVFSPGISVALAQWLKERANSLEGTTKRAHLGLNGKPSSAARARSIIGDAHRAWVQRQSPQKQPCLSPELPLRVSTSRPTAEGRESVSKGGKAGQGWKGQGPGSLKQKKSSQRQLFGLGEDASCTIAFGENRCRQAGPDDRNEGRDPVRAGTPSPGRFIIPRWDSTDDEDAAKWVSWRASDMQLPPSRLQANGPMQLDSEGTTSRKDEEELPFQGRKVGCGGPESGPMRLINTSGCSPSRPDDLPWGATAMQTASKKPNGNTTATEAVGLKLKETESAASVPPVKSASGTAHCQDTRFPKPSGSGPLRSVDMEAAEAGKAWGRGPSIGGSGPLQPVHLECSGRAGKPGEEVLTAADGSNRTGGDGPRAGDADKRSRALRRHVTGEGERPKERASPVRSGPLALLGHAIGLARPVTPPPANLFTSLQPHQASSAQIGSSAGSRKTESRGLVPHKQALSVAIPDDNPGPAADASTPSGLCELDEKLWNFSADVAPVSERAGPRSKSWFAGLKSPRILGRYAPKSPTTGAASENFLTTATRWEQVVIKTESKDQTTRDTERSSSKAARMSEQEQPITCGSPVEIEERRKGRDEEGASESIVVPEDSRRPSWRKLLVGWAHGLGGSSPSYPSSLTGSPGRPNSVRGSPAAKQLRGAQSSRKPSSSSSQTVHNRSSSLATETLVLQAVSSLAREKDSAGAGAVHSSLQACASPQTAQGPRRDKDKGSPGGLLWGKQRGSSASRSHRRASTMVLELSVEGSPAENSPHTSTQGGATPKSPFSSAAVSPSPERNIGSQEQPRGVPGESGPPFPKAHGCFPEMGSPAPVSHSSPLLPSHREEEPDEEKNHQGGSRRHSGALGEMHKSESWRHRRAYSLAGQGFLGIGNLHPHAPSVGNLAPRVAEQGQGQGRSQAGFAKAGSGVENPGEFVALKGAQAAYYAPLSGSGSSPHRRSLSRCKSKMEHSRALQAGELRHLQSPGRRSQSWKEQGTDAKRDQVLEDEEEEEEDNHEARADAFLSRKSSTTTDLRCRHQGGHAGSKTPSPGGARPPVFRRARTDERASWQLGHSAGWRVREGASVSREGSVSRLSPGTRSSSGQAEDLRNFLEDPVGFFSCHGKETSQNQGPEANSPAAGGIQAGGLLGTGGSRSLKAEGEGRGQQGRKPRPPPVSPPSSPSRARHLELPRRALTRHEEDSVAVFATPRRVRHRQGSADLAWSRREGTRRHSHALELPARGGQEDLLRPDLLHPDDRHDTQQQSSASDEPDWPSPMRPRHARSLVRSMSSRGPGEVWSHAGRMERRMLEAGHCGGAALWRGGKGRAARPRQSQGRHAAVEHLEKRRSGSRGAPFERINTAPAGELDGSFPGFGRRQVGGPVSGFAVQPSVKLLQSQVRGPVPVPSSFPSPGKSRRRARRTRSMDRSDRAEVSPIRSSRITARQVSPRRPLQESWRCPVADEFYGEVSSSSCGEGPGRPGHEKPAASTKRGQVCTNVFMELPREHPRALVHSSEQLSPRELANSAVWNADKETPGTFYDSSCPLVRTDTSCSDGESTRSPRLRPTGPSASVDEMYDSSQPLVRTDTSCNESEEDHPWPNQRPDQLGLPARPALLALQAPGLQHLLPGQGQQSDHLFRTTSYEIMEELSGGHEIPGAREAAREGPRSARVPAGLTRIMLRPVGPASLADRGFCFGTAALPLGTSPRGFPQQAHEMYVEAIDLDEPVAE